MHHWQNRNRPSHPSYYPPLVDIFCRQISAPMGEYIFTQSIPCLHQATTPLHHLHIHSAFHHNFKWWLAPHWQDLCLTRLRTLDLRPQLAQTSPSTRPLASTTLLDQRPLDMWIEAPLTVVKIIDACAATLESLVYSTLDDNLPRFMSGDGPQFPRMESLELFQPSASPWKAVKWMRGMPGLRWLGVRGTRMYEPAHGLEGVVSAIAGAVREGQTVRVSVSQWRGDCVEEVSAVLQDGHTHICDSVFVNNERSI